MIAYEWDLDKQEEDERTVVEYQGRLYLLNYEEAEAFDAKRSGIAREDMTESEAIAEVLAPRLKAIGTRRLWAVEFDRHNFTVEPYLTEKVVVIIETSLEPGPESAFEAEARKALAEQYPTWVSPYEMVNPMPGSHSVLDSNVDGWGDNNLERTRHGFGKVEFRSAIRLEISGAEKKREVEALRQVIRVVMRYQPVSKQLSLDKELDPDAIEKAVRLGYINNTPTVFWPISTTPAGVEYLSRK